MRISVVIPLYNKRNAINDTLESVFKQTFQPEEIIVVNDGSTDGSEKIVEALSHPLIKIIDQPNKGVSTARNIGIGEATGEWIAFLDADDIWMPQYLEHIKQLSGLFPECKVLACSYMIQDPAGASRGILLNKLPFTGEYGKLINYFDVSAVSHPPICSSSVVVQKSAMEHIGGFPPSVKSGEDLLTWAKLASEFEIAYSQKKLAVFIQNDIQIYNGQPSRIPEETDIVGNELKSLFKSHSEMPGLKRYISMWFKMRSSIFLRLGMKRKAFNEIISSLRFNPLNLKVYVYLFFIPLPKTCINKLFRKLGQS
jgi:glycosyltransferase involved in cell wall biosynthesis